VGFKCPSTSPGAVLSLVAILREIPGGWGKSGWPSSSPLGKRLRVFDFSPGPARRVLCPELQSSGRGAGRMLPHHGEPRNGSVDGPAAARRGEASAIAEPRCFRAGCWWPRSSRCFGIGACLFALYQLRHLQPPAVLDRIYPLFVWTYLPRGVAGLVMAAILAAAMSNLSAALNALASTT